MQSTDYPSITDIEVSEKLKYCQVNFPGLRKNNCVEFLLQQWETYYVKQHREEGFTVYKLQKYNPTK